MKRILILGTSLLFVSVFAFADTFSGTLVDATCAAQKKATACNPTSSTTAFALQQSDGKMVRLDEAGNAKAAEALKASSNSADRAQDPNAANMQVTATIEGTLNGDELKVDTIQVH